MAIFKLSSVRTSSVIIGVGFGVSIYYLALGILGFASIPGDLSNISQLVFFDILYGASCMVVVASMVFGMAAAYKSNLWMARINVILSVISLIISAGGQVMHLIILFMYKDPLITRCTEIESTGSGWAGIFGFGGTRFSQRVKDPGPHCQDVWKQTIALDVVWFIISLLISFILLKVAYSFYRELRKKSYVRIDLDGSNPSDQVPLRALQVHTQDDHERYPPPAGSPSNSDHGAWSTTTLHAPFYDASTLPGYDHDNAPSDRIIEKPKNG